MGSAGLGVVGSHWFMRAPQAVGSSGAWGGGGRCTLSPPVGAVGAPRPLRAAKPAGIRAEAARLLGVAGGVLSVLAAVGLEFVGRGTAEVIYELPDLDLTVRALAAAGPSWPALQHAGYDRFAETMRQALRPLYVEGLGVRIVSEYGWITGRVPGA